MIDDNRFKKALFRADDFGFSEAVNYGIIKAVSTGLIKNVGCLANMPAIDHGARLISEYKDVCLGLHANITNGYPCAETNKIPNLVKDDLFRSSREYRNNKEDLVVIDEAVIELETQLKAFRRLFGKDPGYIDIHGVDNPNFHKAVSIVAKKNDIVFADVEIGKELNYHGCIIRDCSNLMAKDYNPLNNIKKVCLSNEFDKTDLLVFHPGYVDQYLIDHSSLTNFRCREVDALVNPEAKEMIESHRVLLLRFAELKNL